ncbi:MAG: hypothetical protein WB995_15525 [Candidatus Acidiferrales bacterium]
MEDEKSSAATGRSLSWDVFCQQAAQGYYDDAMATIVLSNRDSDVQYALVTLARIRAKNGDAEGALSAARAYGVSDTREKAIQEIAVAQAERGDVQGARHTASLRTDPGATLEAIAVVQAGKGDLAGSRETIAALSHPNRALEAIGEYQIKSGEFESALETAQEIGPGSSANLLLDVGYELERRGERHRVLQLASKMTNREVAHLFVDSTRLARSSFDDVEVLAPNACDQADFYAAMGEFAAAYDLIKQTKCSYAFVAIKQYATDPVDAEQEVLRSSNPLDVCFGLTELAKAASGTGKISDALRLLDKAQSVCGEKDGYLFGAQREVARFWTIKDGPRIVVKWACSRPTAPQRFSALFGIAVALGHPHP